MIPKRIVTFWHNGRTTPRLSRWDACCHRPSTVPSACIEKMRSMNPTWRVITYTDEVIPKTRPDVRRLWRAHRADWVRLWVLKEKGGVCNAPFMKNTKKWHTC